MDRRDRPSFDNRRQSLALAIVELRWLARRLAVDQTIGTFRVEPQNPVPDRLKRDIAELGSRRSRAASINLRQGE